MRHGLELLKKDAYRRTPHSFAHIVSGGKWYMAAWLQYVGRVLYEELRKGDARVILNAPTRMGKSEFCTFWLSIWFLENFPDRRVIIACHTATLAEEYGGRVRDEFKTNPLLTTKLKDDSQAKNRWRTEQGGGLVAAGVGGPIAAGVGGHLIVADDVCKNWEQATSTAYKNKLYHWWPSLMNRLEPHGNLIIAQCRWTDDDLCARLQTDHPDIWKVLRFPELAEENDILGRSPGEPLFPERYSLQACEQRRIEVGLIDWAACHQQRPESFSTGRLFNRFTAANISNEIALRADLPLAISLDFNINPGNHMAVGQYDAKRDLFIITDEFFGPRWDVRQIINAFCEWLKAKGWIPGAKLAFPTIYVYGDATGESENAVVAESAYDLIRQLLRHKMLPHTVKHLSRNPPVKESVDAVNEAFRDVEEKIHILIHPRCAGLIKDLQTQKRDEDGMPDETDSNQGHYCMVAETPVDTPSGPCRIVDLKPGQHIFTHLGIGRVEAINYTGIREIICLRLDALRYIMCTLDHPCFTDGEWVAARYTQGRRLCLRKKNFPKRFPRSSG